MCGSMPSNPAARLLAQIAKAEALAEAAQQAPWSWKEHGATMHIYGFAGPPMAMLADQTRTDNGGMIRQPFDDARFIAASRTLVPQLAAALRACLGALEQIERADDLDTAIGTAHTALVRAVAAMGDGDGMA